MGYLLFLRVAPARTVSIRSDAALPADGSTRAYVEKHATGGVDNIQEFFVDFGEAMVKMGNIQPATTDGEVRRKCSVFNAY